MKDDCLLAATTEPRATRRERVGARSARRIQDLQKVLQAKKSIECAGYFLFAARDPKRTNASIAQNLHLSSRLYALRLVIALHTLDSTPVPVCSLHTKIESSRLRLEAPATRQARRACLPEIDSIAPTPVCAHGAVT